MASIAQHTASIVWMHDEYLAAAKADGSTPTETEHFLALAYRNGSQAAQRIGLNTEAHTSQQIAWAYDFLINAGDLDRHMMAALGNCEGFLARHAS